MSAQPVAYRPKTEFRDPDQHGAVFVNDATDFNVREAVQSGPDGTFVVADPAVIAVLDRYEALERTSVPQPPKAASKAAAKDESKSD